MPTNIKYKDKTDQIYCALSSADSFPCYDFLYNTSSPSQVDLVCNSLHFTRMSVVIDGQTGERHLKKVENNKLISDFIEEQKGNYSNMPDTGKELFENFASFINIEHSYGAALSLRILIEDFIKDNFIAPAISNHLSQAFINELFDKAKEKDTPYLSLALLTINFGNLLKMMKSPPIIKRNNLNLQKALNNAFCEYISNDKIGILRKLSKPESEGISDIHKTVSSVIHGKRYNALQVFQSSKPFFDILTDFFKKGQKWRHS